MMKESKTKMVTITGVGFREEIRARRETIVFYLKLEKIEIKYPLEASKVREIWLFISALLELMNEEETERIIGKKVGYYFDGNRISTLYTEHGRITVPFYF